MKKRILVLAFLSALMARQVYAQTTTSVNPLDNPGGFYIKGGVNFSNISTSADGSYRDANMLTTFNAGVIADVPLATTFSIQPGVILSGKGAKADRYYIVNGNVVASEKVKLNPLYVEVPVNLVVKLPVAPGTRVFFGAGPYGAIGVGGKYTVEANILGSSGTSTHNLQFGNSNDDDLKSFDYGINALAGVEINHIMLNVNYGLGLAKIVPNSDDNANDKNKYRVLSLNIGFRF